MIRTISLSERAEEGWALCRTALAEVAAGRFPAEEWTARTRQALDRGDSAAVLALEGSELVGAAVWSRTPLPARTVNLLYLVPGRRSPELYRELLRQVVEQGLPHGPVAFSTGDLLGLGPAEQATMMEPLGFRHFTRTEMEFPAELPAPANAPRGGVTLRPTRPEDAGVLAGLHRAAYAGRFDRYLFMEDPDPGRDSELGMKRLLQGDWGPYLPEDSFAAEREGQVVGATIVVRMEGHPLLADVMVDPAHRGQGIAGALIAASIASLRARSEAPLRLNVTNGNARAERLYRSLGFIARGTGNGWYDTRCVPIPPEQD